MNGVDDLTPEEKRALQSLTSGPEPPPGLEDAIVARLHERGALASRSRRPRWAAWSLAAAAGLALFAAGLVVGQRRGGAGPAVDGPVAEATRYVLLLYDAPEEATLSDAEMAARVDEYRNWAIGLRRAGSDISGEKLAQRSLDLGVAEAVSGPEPLGGFFIFSAKDAEAALAIARSCPHLRHGGRAELRPIEET